MIPQMEKKMTKLIFALLLTFVASISYGSNIDNQISLSGLDDTQKAAIIAQIELERKTADATSSVKLPSADVIEKYARLGHIVGGVIKTTAKEIGIAANEFVTTPVGKITMALIVWTVAGEDLFGIAFGLMWLIIVIPAWLYFFNRICVSRDYEYKEVKIGPIQYHRRVVCSKIYDEDRNPVTKLFSILFLIAIVIVGLVSMFSAG